jgi:acyl-CoA thioesterase I
VLRGEPDVVVVGLGGNDGLRGQPLSAIERNLRAIVEKVRAAGARPILLEMTLPTSYGRDYVTGFTALYGRIAEDLDVPLVAGFLRGVGGVSHLNLPDGIHPTAEGHEILAENVLPTLERVLAADR